ncbi:MAG: DUF1795 domain-containing protein [Byssovorax sp.]
MTSYVTNDAEFDVPEEWTDRSINIFAVGSTPPLPLSFVISRDYMKPGQELVDFVEEQLGQTAKNLPKFRLISKRQIVVDGNPALQAEFVWFAEQGAMHQRQAYVPSGAKVLILTATAPVKISDEHEEQMTALLGSLKVKR